MSGVFTNTRIGILGGGQLGRMLIQSGLDFNLNISILDPDPHAPCKDIANHFETGSLTDQDTVYKFGHTLDLITIEIENVNVDALAMLERDGKRVYPQSNIVRLIQDKSLQKGFYEDHGLPTAPFQLVDNAAGVAALQKELPFVNKLAREGYDGRGVVVLRKGSDLSKAFDAPGIVEPLVDINKEISVIVARNASGAVKSFPAVELRFHPTANLVEFLFAPANIAPSLELEAQKLASTVIEKLGMVGLLAVEMFLTNSGSLLINEVAPRPHNSGHQSIEGNVTSQFEQHLRSILDMPLGDTALRNPTAMVNLLGAEGYEGPAIYDGIERVMAQSGVHLHLYGKYLTKPFRKMGHVTIQASSFEELQEKARFVKSSITIKA